jgi:hypothetical protein
LADAERVFGEVRTGFRERALHYDAALAGMDLALVLTLAREILRACEAQGIHPEAVRALRSFEILCEHRGATAERVERFRTFLDRLQHFPPAAVRAGEDAPGVTLEERIEEPPGDAAEPKPLSLHQPPILQPKSLDTGEFTDVVRNQHKASGECLSRNEHVVGADRGPVPLQSGSHRAKGSSGCFIEFENRDFICQAIQNEMVSRLLPALVRTITELGQDDGAEPYLLRIGGM